MQNRTFKFGPGKTRFIEPKRHWPKPLELSSRIALDRERCIRCFRCVRFSQEVAQDGQLTMQERGALSEITTFSGDAYEARFTGNIVDICPVGALTSIPYRFVARPWDVTNTPSICGLCPVGCNTELTTREGELKRVSGRDDPNFAVEEGWLCDKGRWGFDIATSAARLTAPVIREATGDRIAELDDALPAVASLCAGAGSASSWAGRPPSRRRALRSTLRLPARSRMRSWHAWASRRPACRRCAPRPAPISAISMMRTSSSWWAVIPAASSP